MSNPPEVAVKLASVTSDLTPNQDEAEGEVNANAVGRVGVNREVVDETVVGVGDGATTVGNASSCWLCPERWLAATVSDAE